MTPTQQLIAQMRPEEAGSAGHEARGHYHPAYGLHPRNGRIAGLAAALLAAACGLFTAEPARAWSGASAIYTGARPQPLAIAGDPVGNGVGVVAGASTDSSLLLLQRSAVATVPDGVAFAWNAPTPLPGGVPKFTTSTPLAEGAGAAGGGEGAAAIVVRMRVDGADTLSVLVRDAGERFGEPATIVPGNFLRLSDPSVAISVAGTTVIGFDATRASGRRAAYAARLSGNEFGAPRVISLAGAGPVAVAVGPREAGLLAWTRAGRAELSLLGDSGRAGRYRVIGRAARSGQIAAAGSPGGAIVAWEDARGAVRVIRRGAARSGRFGAAITARRATGAGLSGMAAALGPEGVAYVIWREGAGARTRLLVARAAPRRRFKIDQVAIGSGLGRPAMIARPIGGALAGWAARTGWQARKIPTSGGLPVQSTVSAPGTSTAVPLARPFLTAGPGPRADISWLQPSDSGPGYDVMQSQDSDP